MFARLSPGELVFLLRQCLDSGAWDQALALSQALASNNDPGVGLCEAVAHYASGEPQAALGRVDALLSANAHSLPARAIRAEILARTGARERAVAELTSVLEEYPDYPGAQALLGSLLLPGPHYREVLARLHALLKPKTYLEIGVDTGATLTLAQQASAVIGVDPAATQLRYPAPASARLFRQTSDDFFAEHSAHDVLGERRVDLAFIDGMHRFENALSDFANVERWSHAETTLVFHDCVPLIASTARRERETSFWVGDTWKVVLALARHRPDLKIRTLLTPPSGLVVVRKLDPTSTLLRANYVSIVAEFAELEWQLRPGQLPAEFGALPSNEASLAEALA